MQEAQEGFKLSVWLSKLTMREWILFASLVLIVVGPGLLGRPRPAAPEAPVAPSAPEPVAPVPSRKKTRRRKK